MACGNSQPAYQHGWNDGISWEPFDEFLWQRAQADAGCRERVVSHYVFIIIYGNETAGNAATNILRSLQLQAVIQRFRAGYECAAVMMTT